MRIYLLLFLLFCTNGFAQSKLSDWQKVINLPFDADVSIKTTHNKFQGFIDKVEPNNLILYSSERGMPGRKWVYRKLFRNEIIEIRKNRRELSALVGGLIGAGIGVSTGLIMDSRARSNEDKGLLPMTLGIVSGGIGVAIGHTNPFIKGERIYQAPWCSCYAPVYRNNSRVCPY